MDKKSINEYVEERSEAKRKARRNKILGVLAVAVAFCTAFSTITPAFTLEKASCGNEAHSHTDKCYKTIVTPEKKVLSCELEEHAHGDECYETTKTLACGLEENEEHTHTDECYETTKTLVCNIPEHAHSNDCYTIIPESTEMILTCTKEEHEHIDSCYSAKDKEDKKNKEDKKDKESKKDNKQDKQSKTDNAEKNIDEDVIIENSSNWEHMFKDVKLSGNWGDDIVTIASTQIGYRECKGGYTRFGGWYGIPCGDWCAMFASFCLNYAGVKDFPLASNCQEWINTLKAEDVNLYHSAKHAFLEKGYIPKPGDLVFFDWNGSGTSDHVGIVAEYIPAHGVTGAKIITIEGNISDKVGKLSYSYNSDKILGFGEIPLNPAAYAVVDGISMDVEYNEINSTVIFSADIGDIEESDYNWHWERSIDDSESWEAISGANGIVCGAALDENSADALYRLCGMSVDADDESKEPVNIASSAENAIPESSDYLFMSNVFDLGNQPELEKAVPTYEEDSLRTEISQIEEQQKSEPLSSEMFIDNSTAENEDTSTVAESEATAKPVKARINGKVFKYMPNGINTARHPMRGHLLDNGKHMFFNIQAEAILVKPIIVCAFSLVMILAVLYAAYNAAKFYKSRKIKLYSIDDVESFI